jgi:hypothetical protein
MYDTSGAQGTLQDCTTSRNQRRSRRQGFSILKKKCFEENSLGGSLLFAFQSSISPKINFLFLLKLLRNRCKQMLLLARDSVLWVYPVTFKVNLYTSRWRKDTSKSQLTWIRQFYALAISRNVYRRRIETTNGWSPSKRGHRFASPSRLTPKEIEVFDKTVHEWKKVVDLCNAS